MIQRYAVDPKKLNVIESKVGDTVAKVKGVRNTGPDTARDGRPTQKPGLAGSV
jgi:hypothetical protein